ncbi:TadE/TadG family type IV pilus assembly protein [Aporhodopirellula aestuarii]|uniref:Pilus assembly protein n=1 Tax=Aporhodopirellula aestuarii TaxID=2950107 RepID=A0ABT0TWL0_9BACT|nr:TadE family protein [Aporhodopirellula aestuarii]MCM2369012.1 pilus assembly protein [Aporhodopirellula aestuarii]
MTRSRKPRRGAAMVEFACTFPILLLFTFAGIEFSRVNMIRNTAINAAYEGARMGIVPGATSSECEQAAEQLLKLIDVKGATAVATPKKIEPKTESITVTVTVPITSENAFIAPKYFFGKSVTSTVTLPREVTF